MFPANLTRLWVAAFATIASVATASAGPITFDFDALGTNSRNSDVQTYMNRLLTGVGTVTVSNALPMSGYTGDGYVVGPVDTNGNITPITLGGTDKPGTYLVNDGSSNGGDRITMVFSFPISGVSFDFEIFPSAGWQANTPDFSLWADGKRVFQQLGVSPNDPGALYPHSVVSGPNRNEVVPQFIGSYSTSFDGAGVRRLEFVDWPRRIGVDNLTVIPFASQDQIITNPEPASVVLVVGLAGAVGLGWIRRRKAATV